MEPFLITAWPYHVGPYQIRSFKVLGVVELGKSLGNHGFSHQLWGFPVKKGAIQLQIERIQTKSNSAAATSSPRAFSCPSDGSLRQTQGWPPTKSWGYPGYHLIGSSGLIGIFLKQLPEVPCLRQECLAPVHPWGPLWVCFGSACSLSKDGFCA